MTVRAARAAARRRGPRQLPRLAVFRAHTDGFLAAGLFIVAACLRVWGVQWSLPYVGHVDEPKIVDAAVRIIKTGNLNPHLFIWPSLVIYLQALVDRVQVLVGTWTGTSPGPAALPDSNHIFALAPGLYLWGRTASALIGAGAVAGCYALGRAMFGRGAGLVAALLLLTSPLHVEYSHYLVTDVTMGACGLLALAAAWHLATRPGTRAALLAGAAVGLCAAAKYNGVYIGLPVAVAWALAWRRARRTDPVRGGAGRWLALAAGMPALAAAVFLLLDPYVILDWRAWSQGFVFQVNAYVPATDLAGAVTALTKQIGALWTTDTVLLAAGVLGSLVLLVDALRPAHRYPARGPAAWLLLPFPVVYTLLMSRFTEVYERNLIVTLPCLCLAAGYGTSRLAEVGSGRWAVGQSSALDGAEGSGIRDQGSDRATQPAQHATPNTPHPPSKIQNSKFKIQHSPTAWALLLGLLLAAEPGRRSVEFARYIGLPESRNLADTWLQGQLRAGHRAAVELHPWQLCAPPPYACPAPDVYATNAPLTERPPAWYAAHGYDYVLLVGIPNAIVGDPDKEGPRPAVQLAPYLALPVVHEWPGDRAGDKGPDVRVLRTAAGPPAPAGVTRSGAQLGALAELWGYALAPLATAAATWDPAEGGAAPAGPYHPGAAVGVQLYWRALPGAATTPGNWTVALHLSDAAGSTVAQVDVVPISGGRRRPLQEWYAQEFLAGAYNMPLPSALAPGTYRLTLALYDAPAGRALPAQLPGRPATAVLDLGALAVAR